MDEKRRKSLRELQKILKVKFANLKLLDIALTHRTFAVESNKSIDDNERLEFLGDAVLGLAISRYLYDKFKYYSEGELSMARSRLVNEKILANKARAIRLGKYLSLGKGEGKAGGRNKNSILASAIEAVIGEIYLEHGFKGAYRFIIGQFKKDINALAGGSLLKDPKGRLQEIIHKKFKKKVIYRTVPAGKFSHRPLFEAKAIIGRAQCGKGWGRTKKEAEQGAATSALKSKGRN